MDVSHYKNWLTKSNARNNSITVKELALQIAYSVIVTSSNFHNTDYILTQSCRSKMCAQSNYTFYTNEKKLSIQKLTIDA